MRLLNSDTKAFHLFERPECLPPYAILSHTWGDQEVTFQDMADIEKARKKAGFSKITGVCKKALSDGFKYVWVDTCCINKESSAELSEAINTMYSWYKNAQVCYVHLADVPSDEDPSAIYSTFSRSRWFSRGWTLQELLAPASVIFHGADWVEIGTKTSLQRVVSATTGIPSMILLANHPAEVSIAQRMSWAANRQTTRAEDLAYCLMGLFDVNMSIIYGEGGQKAFIRLQQEIVKSSDDQTIFAWKAVNGGDKRGPLANSPAEFTDLGDLVPGKDHTRRGHLTPYSITNIGLRIELPLVPLPENKNLFLAILNCTHEDDDKSIAIYVKKKKDGYYYRAKASTSTESKPKNTKPSAIFIKDPDVFELGVAQRMPPPSQYVYTVRTNVPKKLGFAVTEAYPPEFWAEQEHGERSLTMSGSGTSGILVFKSETRLESFAVMLGVHNYSVWSDIVTNFGDETPEDIRESYYGGKRSSKLWDNLDRSSAGLQNGQMAFVSIKNVIIAGQRQLLAEIQIKSGGIGTGKPSQWVRPKTEYLFWVSISTAEHGFDVSEAFPTSGDPHWVENGDMRFLCLDHSGSSGILMFENAETGEKFAVMMGVHNYRVWTDVVTNFGDESAEDIRNSYYQDFQKEISRNDILWLQRSQSGAQIKEEKSVCITTRSNNNADFMTDISIKSDAWPLGPFTILPSPV